MIHYASSHLRCLVPCPRFVALMQKQSSPDVRILSNIYDSLYINLFLRAVLEPLHNVNAAKNIPYRAPMTAFLFLSPNVDLLATRPSRGGNLLTFTVDYTSSRVMYLMRCPIFASLVQEEPSLSFWILRNTSNSPWCLMRVSKLLRTAIALK